MPTALLSVYDKTGIVELADGLHDSAGESSAAAAPPRRSPTAGIPVTDLAELTGVPAILDHRVVTLHPKIHGGLLADPTKPEHHADMAAVRHRADRPRGRATCTRSPPTRASS